MEGAAFEETVTLRSAVDLVFAALLASLEAHLFEIEEADGTTGYVRAYRGKALPRPRSYNPFFRYRPPRFGTFATVYVDAVTNFETRVRLQCIPADRVAPRGIGLLLDHADPFLEIREAILNTLGDRIANIPRKAELE